jgi:hypothetical protein
MGIFVWPGAAELTDGSGHSHDLGLLINDKIVILDRIREDLKLGVRGSFRELINLALNQT